MKTNLIIGLIIFLFVGPAIVSAEVPHGVGGFVLDRNIKEFADRVIMETALSIRHMENFEEVEIKFTDGFKSGLIAYTTCAKPGHIARIKLKYADASKVDIVLLKGKNISLTYNDDGKGFDVDKILKKKKGMGLHNLKTRVESVNGRYNIYSTPGKGVRLKVIIPHNE